MIQGEENRDWKEIMYEIVPPPSKFMYGIYVWVKSDLDQCTQFWSKAYQADRSNQVLTYHAHLSEALNHPLDGSARIGFDHFLNFLITQEPYFQRWIVAKFFNHEKLEDMLQKIDTILKIQKHRRSRIGN